MKVKVTAYLVEDGRQLRGQVIEFPEKRARQLIEMKKAVEVAEDSAPVEAAQPTPEETPSGDAAATRRRGI